MSEHDAEQEQRPEPGSQSADDPSAPRRRRGPRRAVRKGAERESGFGVTRDERGGHGSNDERLRRDVPPHW